MSFILLFSVKSRLDTLFACSSTVSIQIVHADYLRRTAQLSAVVHVEPRNSVEKLFSVSHTVRSARRFRFVASGIDANRTDRGKPAFRMAG